MANFFLHSPFIGHYIIIFKILPGLFFLSGINEREQGFQYRTEMNASTVFFSVLSPRKLPDYSITFFQRNTTVINIFFFRDCSFKSITFIGKFGLAKHVAIQRTSLKYSNRRQEKQYYFID